MNSTLKGKKEWATISDPYPYSHKYSIKTNHRYTWTGDPIIDFKTRASINRGTALQKKVLPRWNLPYWGNIKDLRKEMFE